MVSIITSVYNSAEYISEMLDSILAQSYPDWELIIIDDASTDATWDIIMQYKDARIISVKNEKNLGLTVNLNKALSMAKGEYIIRIDGDDIAWIDRIMVQVRYMNENPDVAVAGCWMKMFGDKTGILQCSLDADRLKINLIFNAVLFHPTLIIRKSILDQYKIAYDTSLRYAQDYALEYEISKYAKIGSIDKILVDYRVHKKQISIEKQEKQLLCANKTRKKILEDLGVDLSDEELRCWSDFCLFQKNMSDDKLVPHVIQKIIEKNRVECIYNEKMLERILIKKYDEYKNVCLKDVMTTQNIEEKNCKYYGTYIFMVMWMKALEDGLNIEKVLLKNDIHKIAIYGAGYIGKLLLDHLRTTAVSVQYGIDKNIEYNFMDRELLIYSPDYDELPEVDAVIVTPFYIFESIRESLKTQNVNRIISIETILENRI